MNVNRVVNVIRGDPVKTLQEFLGSWWQQYALDAMLAPVELPDKSGIKEQVIMDPQGLMEVNPFVPLMIDNAATMAIQMIQDYPTAKVAIMLRPCELRTFLELKKMGRVIGGADNFILIGVDCPGTLPKGEFHHQVEALGLGALIGSVLHNATKGHLQSAEMRTACRICNWFSPKGTDLTVGVIGVDSEEFLLLIAHDEAIDAKLKLGAVVVEQATEYQVSHRETIIGAVADMRVQVRNHLMESFQSKCRFNELGCLLSYFANCTICGECLRTCPLYSGSNGKTPANLSSIEELVYLSRWLASCTGCGICEQNCKQKVPLTLLVSSLNHRICQELNYLPGEPSQPFPWTVDVEKVRGQ